MSPGFKKALKLVLVNLAVFAGLVTLIEGSASVICFFKEIATNDRARIAERLHTQFDPDLGWSNVPGKRIAGMYGPGKDVTINSQGFRSGVEYSTEVPAGKVRAICSGDSFTFGFGVGDSETWVSKLEGLDSRLETVNMGLGGYGLDQAYLWYLRDGAKLDHDIHIFAFIKDDFTRLFLDKFQGYGKPYLRVENSSIAVKNVPVRKTVHNVGWLADNIESINRLRTLQLFNLSIPPLGYSAANNDVNEVELTAMVFDHLSRINASKKSTLALIYLPMRSDLAGRNDETRKIVASLARANGWLYFDLTENFMSIPPEYAEKLFIKDDNFTNYERAGGHYTEEGNSFIAKAIYLDLVSVPQIAEKILAAGARR